MYQECWGGAGGGFRGEAHTQALGPPPSTRKINKNMCVWTNMFNFSTSKVNERHKFFSVKQNAKKEKSFK